MKHQISTIEIIFGILAFLGIWYHVKCNQICYFIHIFSALNLTKNSENQYSSAQSFVSEILGEMEVLSPLRKITKIQKVGIRRNGKAFLS